MRKLIVILLCMSTVLFTGCSHITQLHERLVVQGIGVDLVDGQYIVTMQVFDALNSGSSGGEVCSSDLQTSRYKRERNRYILKIWLLLLGREQRNRESIR